MGHPCLTLCPITPGSESPPTVRTTASCLKYRYSNNLLCLQSMHKLFSISNILTQFTLSNAFSKSTKQIYTSFPHSKLLSHNVLITLTASLVPQPFLNPTWFCPNKCLAFASILFVSTFNIIFEA